MKIVNLHGYAVSYYDFNGNITVLEAGKGVPKLNATYTVVCSENGIKIGKFAYPAPESVGIPKPQKDTYYVVSKEVCQAYPERKDLIYPSNFVKNEEGKIVGCKMLVIPA
jgi:hypothetical protein